MLGVELHGPSETRGGFVPVVRLDRQAPQEELPLREVRLALDQLQQDLSRAVVRLLLDLIARERQIRFLGVRIERDHLFELGFGFRELLLRAQHLRERHVAGGVRRRERHRAAGCGDRVVRRVGAGQPLRQLRPEVRRVRIL